MEVRISEKVYIYLTEFYAISMALHPTLDEEVVQNKKSRLINALLKLGRYADALPYADVKNEWVKKRYRDYHVEGFHFAYRIECLSEVKRVVVVYDVCHDLLYY